VLPWLRLIIPPHPAGAASAGLRPDAQAMSEELPFSVVRSNGTDEVLARAVNMLPRGAYREAAKMYPDELIELRQGARVIERSSRSFGDIYLCGRA
jgi:hypothetical protein